MGVASRAQSSGKKAGCVVAPDPLETKIGKPKRMQRFHTHKLIHASKFTRMACRI
jgi:hypothetical protein